jgi:hypothetical protein
LVPLLDQFFEVVIWATLGRGSARIDADIAEGFERGA